jgi:tetratricopeptide (TPR) repeat protein
LLEVLGEGGMGTVYLAEQSEPIERRVALKLLRADLADGWAARRFETEAQALARMSHPNIARVFEAGTTFDGQPWLALEPIAGPPITTYCDDRRLDLRQRLELFAEVCDGVQHAHQKAVLHRDLKPTNVLVTEEEGRARPKIIDFGIARALDRPLTGQTLHTQLSFVLGTPAYLSPEAVRAADGRGDPGTRDDLDTRSDVYSLGVLLYELLTGKPPFVAQSSMAILRRIVEEEPVRPSVRVTAMKPDSARRVAEARRLEPAALARSLRGDLDWIILRAMAKDRDRRYPSAAELAADVRRHLRDEPVAAGPPSALYRLGKLARRHRAGVAAAALILLALVGGLAARSLEAARANREAARANQEAEAAREVAEFLTGLFRVADPGSVDANQLSVREILDRGAERVRGELADQPLTRARLMETMGNAYQELGLYGEAEELLGEALRLRRQELGEEHRDVAVSLNDLATVYRMEGKSAEALPLLEQARGILEDASDPRALAGVLMELASFHANQGDLDEAVALNLRALALREGALGPEHEDVAATLNNLANLYFDQGRYDEAEKLHLRAIAIKEKTLGPEHFFLAQSLNNLANVYRAQNRIPEAEELHRRALEIKRKTLDPNHAEIGVSVFNLGDLAFDRGDLETAGSRFHEALKIWTASLPPDHPYLAYAYQGLGNVARDEGRRGEAVSLYRRALEIRRLHQPVDHPLVEELERQLHLLGADAGEAAAPPAPPPATASKTPPAAPPDSG